MKTATVQQGGDSVSLSNTTSDDDFWCSLEPSPVLSLTAPALKTSQNHDKTAFPVREKSDLLDISHIEKSIKILRAAKNVEVRNASLQAKNHAKVSPKKKQFEEEMERLRENHEQELKEFQGNYDDVKAILYRKDVEIERIRRMMYDQEITLTRLRLTGGGRHYRKAVKVGEYQEIEELRSECSRLKSQLDTIHSLCHLYQEESNQAKSALESAHQTIKHQALECDKLLKALEARTDTREKELIQEKNSLLKAYFSLSFEEYKRHIEEELKVRDLVTERQNLYIQSLQEELKSAKMVLRSPRLRNKMMSRAKDLEETMRSEEGRGSKTPKGRSKSNWKGSSFKGSRLDSVSPPPLDLRTAKVSVQLPSLSIPGSTQVPLSP